MLLLLTYDLFFDPQTKIPPFLFSEIKLKRSKGQHSPFCLDHVQIPYYLLEIKLFFMILGNEF